MTEALNPARTCILVFDLLEGHVNKDAGSRARFAPVVANARRILDAARRAGAIGASLWTLEEAGRPQLVALGDYRWR